MQNESTIQMRRVETLDSRAYVARLIASISFFCLIAFFAMLLPFFFFERKLLEPQMLVVLGYIVIMLIVSLIFSALIKKLIGGIEAEYTGVSATFSSAGLSIDGVLFVHIEEIQRLKVRRFQLGCIDVAIVLRSGNHIRLTPLVDGNDEVKRRREYCNLCESIRSKLSEHLRL